MMVFMKMIQKLTELAKNAREDRIFVELRGRQELAAEGFCRLEKYTDSAIIVCGDGEHQRLGVFGKGLELKHLGTSAIGIIGRIDRVEYL